VYIDGGVKARCEHKKTPDFAVYVSDVDRWHLPEGTVVSQRLDPLHKLPGDGRATEVIGFVDDQRHQCDVRQL